MSSDYLDVVLKLKEILKRSREMAEQLSKEIEVEREALKALQAPQSEEGQTPPTA